MKRFPLWHLALVIGLCVLAYANTLSGAFLWDDEIQIVKNANLRSLSSIPSAFTTPFWGFANTSAPNQSNFYRPLQTVAYTVGYWIGGLSPTPDHVFNLALHAAGSVFVYLICIELGFAAMYALLGAALFAAHPIHTEAVAWIAATPDVACGAFYFAAFWAFLKSRSGEDKKWLGISAVLMLPALLSKEMAITLPGVVLLYTFRSGAPAMTMGRRVALLVPYAGVAALYLAMRANALGFLATTHTEIEASAVDWVTLGVRVFGQYAWQAVIPYPLIAYHLIEIHLADRVGPTLAALGLIVALAGLAWKFRARLPEGWMWYVAFAMMLAPVFYFKGISNALLSERYLYIPSIAPVVVAVAVLSRLPAKCIWAAWGAVAIFGLVTVARNRDWRDAEHLYLATLESNPEVAHLRINLAEILLGREDDANALQHLNRAMEALESRKYSQVAYDFYRAHIGLGAILARARNYPQAREHLEAAKKLLPSGEWSYLYLGGIAMEADNDMPKALEQLQTAVKLGPLNEVARDYLGIALFNTGRFQEAKAQFEEALKINPTHRDARVHLEMAERSLAGQ